MQAVRCARFARWLLLACLLFGALRAVSLPRPPLPTAPPGVALPDGFDVVPLPGLAAQSPVAEAPAIAEFTRSGAPGDTLAISGWQLSRHAGIEAGRDTRFLVVAARDGALVEHEADIIHQNGDMAAVRLPSALPAWSTYFLYPVNAAGAGPAVLVNKTELWWCAPKFPAPGEALHVFGRNLSRADAEQVAWIYLKPTGSTAGAGRWLRATSAAPLHGEYLLPADLPAGPYTLQAHNTHGGAYGWSEPLALEVKPRLTYAGATFDITAYGAVADDTVDDAPAIQAAIHAALDHGNATVLIPAGRFVLNTTPYVRANSGGFRIQGAGRDATIITHGGAGFLGHALLDAQAGNFMEVRDLTFDSFTQEKGNFSLLLRGSRNCRIVNVAVKVAAQPYINGMDAHMSDNLWFENCVFITGGGNFLGSSTHTVFQNCLWRGRNDVNSLNYVWGGRGVAFLDCEARNDDPASETGHSIGRFVSGAGVWGANRHLYFGRVRTIDQAARLGAPGVEQNAGEQIMFEALVTDARESVASATATTLRTTPVGSSLTARTEGSPPESRRIVGWDYSTGTLTISPDFVTVPGTDSWLEISGRWFRPTGATANTVGLTRSDHTGKIAVIVAGKGLGQSRDIVSRDPASDTYTLDHPFLVVPDTTSVVAIGRYMTRAGVYGCQFDGKLENVLSPDHTASSAVQPYGGAQEIVVQRNTMNELREGISNWAITEQTDPEVQPNYFNLFAENTMTAVSYGVSLVSWEIVAAPGIPGLLGNVFRKNHFVNPLSVAFESHHEHNDTMPSWFNVFDGNIADATPAGLYFRGATVADQVVINNRFNGVCDAPGLRYGDAAFHSSVPAAAVLRENQFTGFGRLYGGNPPGPLPALPRRVAELTPSAPTASVPVWNVGTAPLAWEVVSAPAWLSVTPPAGTVASEVNAAELSFAAAPGTAAGDYSGVVVLSSAAGLTRALTVSLHVASPGSAAFGAWLASEGVAPGLSAGDDPDGDGLSLLTEYALGGHALVRDAASALLPACSLDPATGRLRISFLRARADLIYTVKGGADPTTWAALAVNPGNVGETVVWLDAAPPAPRRFLRLQITLP